MGKAHKPRESLVEYLYVDERRLDSYLEQISSPLIFEKTPTWSVGLSIAGLRAEGLQSRFPRPLSQHEKIQRLMTFLRDSTCFGRGRPVPGEDGPSVPRISPKVFRLEELSAQRVVIPPKEGLGPSRGLAIWLAQSPVGDAESTDLALLEDFPRDDRNGALSITAYSALMFLLEDLWEELKSTIVTPESLATRGGLRREREAGRELFVAKAESRTHYDLRDVLDQVGCRFAPVRRIEVLYRVRARGFVSTQIFGYPIFTRDVAETSEG